MTLILSAATVCALAMSAGCCAFASKDPCAGLRESNQSLETQNKILSDQVQARDARIAGLQSTINEQNDKIVQLTTQLGSRPAVVVAPAPAPEPAGEVLTGPTGFEGTGEVSRQAGAVTVAIPSDLLFDSGKATLKAAGSLGRIAEVIRAQYAGKRIRVRGHTDSDPIRRSGWKDNWDLGFNRARAVALKLIELGVPASSIEMDSLADTQPLGRGKAHDRRVEIQVVLQE
ncbi:MAG: hypothetical protein BIFFINMI_01046 [Phycisphaerae bacterium]|nr:hypothetical protein [Phycisphaerae bacterium]